MEHSLWCSKYLTLRGFLGELSQLVERLLCKQDVSGSSPLFSILPVYSNGREGGLRIHTVEVRIFSRALNNSKMASSGIINFQRNWQGSDHQTTVKKTVSVYRKDDNGSFQAAGAVNAGTSVTYIDSLTEDHLRAAFRTDDGEVFYANVDYFVKPGKERQSVLLRPSIFGLSNRTFFSVTDYYNELVNALNRRNDIPGELFDYLYELLDYVDNGYGDFNGIKFDGFPWGEIQSYYAEVIGPIACIKRGILSGLLDTSGLGGASIYIPGGSEALYDYKLVSGNKEYLISAKSARAVSNQVKPQFVIPYIKSSNLIATTEYQVLQSLANERNRKAVIQGPFYTWQIIQSNGEITGSCISDIINNYTSSSKSNTKLVDPSIWQNFINLHLPSKKSKANIKNVTYGEIRYECEQLIERWSRSGTQNRVLKEIFNEFLNQSRVIYVKLDLNQTTGRPIFTASAGGGTSLVRNLYLRTSNYATRTEDRIGFQVS